MSRSVRHLTALAFIVLSAAGCYTYRPIPFETLPPGENVRIFMTRNAMLGLEEIVPMTGPSVRGRVVRREGDQLYLRIPSGTRTIGFHSEQFDQEVPISVNDITQVERREFNRMGTGAFIAGGIGATAVVLFVIIEAYGESEFPDECTDCADFRLPLITIPFR